MRLQRHEAAREGRQRWVTIIMKLKLNIKSNVYWTKNAKHREYVLSLMEQKRSLSSKNSGFRNFKQEIILQHGDFKTKL